MSEPSHQLRECHAVLLALVALTLTVAPSAKDRVEGLMMRDGEDPTVAAYETLTWRRAEDSSRTRATVSLLGGTYKVYAAGDALDDHVSIDVTDMGTGRVVGAFVVGAEAPVKAGVLTIGSASILSVTANSAVADEVAKRLGAYNVVIGFVRSRSKRGSGFDDVRYIEAEESLPNRIRPAR